MPQEQAQSLVKDGLAVTRFANKLAGVGQTVCHERCGRDNFLNMGLTLDYTGKTKVSFKDEMFLSLTSVKTYFALSVTVDMTQPRATIIDFLVDGMAAFIEGNLRGFNHPEGIRETIKQELLERLK